LDHQSPPTLAFGALRLAAMGLAWYLLAVTLAGLLARAVGSGRWAAAMDALSPTVVRRLVQGAAGLSLTAAVTGTQAAAWSAPASLATTASPVPIMRRLPATEPAPTAPGATTASATRQPDAAPRTITPPRTTTPPRTIPSPPPPPTWVIRSGDNLWSVAEATLAGAWGRPPSDAEIDDYWMELIAANRARLVHGDDPDLVFPGQVFLLPTPPAPDRP
jgi:nucleoid-associated protein YgaU